MENNENDYLVCRHLGITRNQFIQVIKEKNLTTVEEVMDETDAGSICGSCIYELNIIMEELEEEMASKKK